MKAKQENIVKERERKLAQKQAEREREQQRQLEAKQAEKNRQIQQVTHLRIYFPFRRNVLTDFEVGSYFNYKILCQPSNQVVRL